MSLSNLLRHLLHRHRRHYHPSNAVFMTYGDRAPADLQARFHALALQRFDSVGEPVSGRDEKRRLAPLRVEEAYAPESADGPQTHHVLAWLLEAGLQPVETRQAVLRHEGGEAVQGHVVVARRAHSVTSP